MTKIAGCRIRRAGLLATGFAAVLAVAGPASAAAPGPVNDRPSAGTTFDGPVYAVAYAGDVVYVGGEFTAAISGGHRTARTRLAALDAVSGRLLSWAPSADATVRMLAVSADSVYAGGEFDSVNGVRRDGVAQLDLDTGQVGSFSHAIGGQPHALAIGTGRLYLGGRFTSVDGQQVGNLAAFDLGTGALERGWRAGADSVVYGVTATPDRIYLGGDFSVVDGQPGTAKLAAVDPVSGAPDTGFTPEVNVVVHSVAIGPDGVYAALGGPGGRVIGLTSTGDPLWRATMDGDVQALAYLNGVIYLGGHFDNACRTPAVGVHGVCLDGSERRVKLAAVDAGTGQLLSWNPQGNGVHGTFAVAADPDLDRIAVAGEFTTLGGTSWQRFAQFSQPGPAVVPWY